MAKTYFNNAIIGNSSMLGCLTDKGELVRLFWPHIDFPQHIDKLAAGIFFTDRANSTMWLEGNEWQHSQSYIKDTNIVETVCINSKKGFRAVQVDFVLPDKDVLVRRYEIENIANHGKDIGFILYSAGISNAYDPGSVLFDFDSDSVVNYRPGYYISISADRDVYRFQLGSDAYKSAKHSDLKGCDDFKMVPESALSWKLGKLGKGEKKVINVIICASRTLNGVRMLTRSMKGSDLLLEYENTRLCWLNYIKQAKYVERISELKALKIEGAGKEEAEELYKRSLLVFKLMADKTTGGLMAAPENDEEFGKCGGYAYCWVRDAAFITGALDRCGLSGIVDKFYEWAVKIQDDSGIWHQRYHMDGNLAPSWGEQIDETGALIWGMLKHYEAVKDMEFLENMWDSIQKGVNFLLCFIDHETGLPKPSYDLWEERVGEHTYSSAAVYAGIKAGVEIAGRLGVCKDLTGRWQAAAEGIRCAMEQSLWKEEYGRFLRSIRAELHPWENEYSNDKIRVTSNPKGCCRDVAIEDGTVDVSLLGVAIPFEVFEVEDYRVKSTVDAIERAITSPTVGGIKRYEDDIYIGGNPWILATLWVALYYVRAGDFKKARGYFDWVLKSRTSLGLLPEQVSKDTGEPAWVIPLTWSHAMFVLVLTELLDKGEL